MRIVTAALASQLRAGESIAVNGACVTVVEQDHDGFAFDAGPETLRRTNLGLLRPGDRVNLERAMRVGDRLGGHWLQGHVEDVGRIADRRRHGECEYVRFECAEALTRLMVPRGSIAVDGVSLTLTEVTAAGFSVMLVPFTLTHTTLGFRQVGDAVNLETDILAKHVERLLSMWLVRPLELLPAGCRITSS